MRSYIRKEKNKDYSEVFKNFACTVADVMPSCKPIALKVFAVFFVVIFSVFLISKVAGIAGSENYKTTELSEKTLAAITSQKSVISIPAGMVKANPFLPYRDITETGVVNDIPAFNIVEPPEYVNENSDAARVMDTIVSGILYDKFSPSAIINIEGNDYLVKKGDVVNNYKVLDITQDSVTVKLGANVYKAGIGEILTEGTIKQNEVSNLSNKFGGVK